MNSSRANPDGGPVGAGQAAAAAPGEMVAMGPFDLDSVTALTSAVLWLKHPLTGKPLPASVVLAGPEHDARKAARWSIMRRRRALLAATGDLPPPDPREDEDDELAVLVACTLGWCGLARSGVALEFSAGACTTLYTDPRWSWVREQVKDALDDRARFISGSAPA